VRALIEGVGMGVALESREEISPPGSNATPISTSFQDLDRFDAERECEREDLLADLPCAAVL
jgi:hypothetical protein